MKKRNIIILIVIGLIVVGIVSAVLYIRHESLKQRNAISMSFYVDGMFYERFFSDGETGTGGVTWTITMPTRDERALALWRNRITHITFVHTEEEALQYIGTRTLAVWPGQDTKRALAALNLQFYHSLSGDSIIDVPESLAFPVTAEDLVYRPGCVRDLWYTLAMNRSTSAWNAVEETWGWAAGGERRKHAIELGLWPSENG